MILGHSFVRDLSNYVSQSQVRSNLGLSPSARSVVLTGRPGMLLCHLRESLQQVIAGTPDVVLLDIGGNDIDNGRVPGHALATQLFTFCRQLLASGVKVVVILEVPYRARVCRGTWRTVGQMNEAITRFNAMCQALCRSSPGARIRFWHHDGMVHQWGQYLKRDGVHFNDRGMAKYFRSVRSAVIRYSSLARAL